MPGRIALLASWALPCLLLFLTLAGKSVSAPDHSWYEIYFSRVRNDVAQARADPHSIDRMLAQKIALANVSIDAALHEIDSDCIAQALVAWTCQAARRMQASDCPWAPGVACGCTP